MWMFDRTNLTGNEICFVGAGEADLQYYKRGSSWNWSGATRSFYAGYEYGYFWIPFACTTNFPALALQGAVSDSCILDSVSLTLSD